MVSWSACSRDSKANRLSRFVPKQSVAVVFSRRIGRTVPKSSVVGEVFPEGGGVVRRIVPLQREAEGCAAGGRLQEPVEDTLEPPDTGKLPRPQERTSASISNGLPHRPAICIEGAVGNLLRLFFSC